MLQWIVRQLSGKRNYAMLLLALRTGLRSIDIVNLKLGDIQWKRNTIEIVQAKTGTPLVLPLLTDVGNAIADYILNGRPDSQQPYIFLRTQAPYRKLSGQFCRLWDQLQDDESRGHPAREGGPERVSLFFAILWQRACLRKKHRFQSFPVSWDIGTRIPRRSIYRRTWYICVPVH